MFGNNKRLEDMIIDNKIQFCPKCGGKMMYLYSGVYKCNKCGFEQLSDFGKVKLYIEQHGPSSAYIISAETGVPIETINAFLKKGRVEIPENSPVYIKCERCGCDIRYGRYCPKCVRELAGGIQQAFLADEVGEVPKRKAGKYDGKMRFIGQDHSF